MQQLTDDEQTVGSVVVAWMERVKNEPIYHDENAASAATRAHLPSQRVFVLGRRGSAVALVPGITEASNVARRQSAKSLLGGSCMCAKLSRSRRRGDVLVAVQLQREL